MKNFFSKNIGLVFRRTAENTIKWNQIFISENILDINFLSAQTYIFPLFIYPDPDKKGLFDKNVEAGLNTKQNRQPNINPKIFDMFVREGFKPSPTPEQIFYYIYAVLYSNIYREKYAEFLKIDFPRIPFTKDYDLFIELGKLGQELAEIHLMKFDQLNNTFSRFEISGNNTVKKVEYVPDEGVQNFEPLPEINRNKKDSKENGKVFINKTQYFSDIDKNIWEYQIGGYQVMHKWLKDRKGRALTLEDIQLYIKIAKALQLTIEYQKKIDKLYPKIEKKLIDFSL
jgi:predicted helicase